MAVYGYARVSSTEQNLDRQIRQLRQYVDESHIVTDKASGKNLERPGYLALRGPLGLRRGDTLYICSLDRLSRNKEELKEELEKFREKGVRLVILDLPTSMIDAPEGQKWIVDMVQNILIEVLASMAEQERLTIRKRQREGIEAAKEAGKHMGRPKVQMPKDFPEVYEKWSRGEITAKAAQRELGLSCSSFYRLAKRYDPKGL